MKNLKLEITEQDIQRYLKKYKEYYKYRETMFIKYLKDNKNNITEEMIEILTEGRVKIDNSGELPIFDPMPSNVNNLDLSGICHILIPATRYYDWDRPVSHKYALNGILGIIATNLEVPTGNYFEPIDDTVEDYGICRKITIEENEYIRFKLSRENARKELLAYEDFYGEDKVKQIRKMVRERVRKYV